MSTYKPRGETRKDRSRARGAGGGRFGAENSKSGAWVILTVLEDEAEDGE